MTVYLDACCVSRPFDDQRHERIRAESEAVLYILERIERQEWRWIGSEVLTYEMAQIRAAEKRLKNELLIRHVSQVVMLTDDIVERGTVLEGLGLGAFDALHVASAESVGADVMLSTDDRLVRLSARHATLLSIVVLNPVVWLREVKSS